MIPKTSLIDRLLQVVTNTSSYRIEDLVDHFPDLTWNEVFREVTRLTRDGQLQLVVDGQGIIVKGSDDVLLVVPSFN